MRANRILAIINKQKKDLFRNPMMIILFIFFPIMSFILTITVANHVAVLTRTYFPIMFAVIFIGLIPTVCMANIIAEEKEKNTLRVLIMSNIKPVEYLLGVGVHLFVLSVVAMIMFGIIGGFEGMEFIYFIIASMFGCMASIILGAAIGMSSNNQMAANGIAVPIGVITAYFPMIAGFSKPFETVSKYLYTQQINYLLNDLQSTNFTLERVIIISVNIIVLITCFTLIFRKKGVVA